MVSKVLSIVKTTLFDLWSIRVRTSLQQAREQESGALHIRGRARRGKARAARVHSLLHIDYGELDFNSAVGRVDVACTNAGVRSVRHEPLYQWISMLIDPLAV